LLLRARSDRWVALDSCSGSGVSSTEQHARLIAAQKVEPDGAANGSQPTRIRDKSNTIGGWLPSLTFAFGELSAQ
jgi:hypothetical protein